MPDLIPSKPPCAPVYLDRPQLGLLPTLRFWNQPEVWRHAGWMVGIVAGVWAVLVGVALIGSPLWLLALVGAAGPLLTLGALERHVRRRMRERVALAAGQPVAGSGEID
ncbi:hypothetical protein [Nannocystis pusilla]|uniref:DUF2530 domain-containing protein n=1 Tax=Nannocystis pusilla TaxID=889268 RepID=A0ABS7TV29_9BACT|nr:hypothetical protein [Nannocystis pusilla]MBZ5712074.1 hypothetical protein [Nannocystis pusilla]